VEQKKYKILERMMIGVMRKKKKRDVREEEEGIFKVKMDKKMW